MTDPDVLAAAIVRLHAEGAGDKAQRLLDSLKKQQKAMSALDAASGGALVPASAGKRPAREVQLKRMLGRLVRRHKRGGSNG